MRRFYAHPRQFDQDLVTLDREETLHLARVLRLSVGARVEVCDGEGGNFAAQVATLEPRGATLRILGKLNAWGESPLPVVLGIGLAKGEAMDEAVRQATEMGVTRIFPFTSERSERLSPERLERRRGRWQRLARESIKSCQRSMLPLIEVPRDFAAALEGPEEVKLIFWEEERGGGLKSFLNLPRPQDVRVLIGPEGGFSSGEAGLAREAGFHVVSLGPRRLKVPTATLAAITLIQYAWGDLA
jgi:16S rRNA (uracil1498-N3)-methyltransferase